MTHLFSKYIFHTGKHRTIISHIAIIAFFSGLLIIICIPYACCLFDDGYSPYARCTSVMAQGKGRQISDAVSLPFGNPHHISIEAHGEKYYYITVQKNSFLKILSGASSIRLHFYNDRGKHLIIPLKERCYYFQKTQQTFISSGSRIFIKFTNISTRTAELTLKYQTEQEDEKKKHTTPKPKITSSSKKNIKAHARSDSAKTTHSSPPATGSRTKRILSVTPHFIQLAPGTKTRLSISVNSVPVSLTDYHYFLTEPSLLSVHNNTITAKKEGTTILYFRAGQSDVCGSCFIRIIKLD